MRTETAVYESNDRVTAIIDSLDEPAFVLDETETVIHLNQAAAAILAVERDQIIGQPFEGEIDHYCINCARVRAALKRAWSFPPSEQQVELSLTVQGRDHTYLLKQSSLRNSDGNSLGILVVLRDIAELREKSRPRDNAVVVLAQELNTPLTSLSLAVGLLQRSGDRQSELIREIVEDVNRLNHASADFLNVMREQPRSISLRSIKLNLTTVINAVAGKFESRIERRQIQFAVHAESILEVSGDPLKLSWVIATLVDNALRYTPEMGKIDLTAKNEEEQIRVSVWDSGPGIPLQTRELVFGNPHQAGGALQSLGTGISLAIAKEIIEAHGGRLFAEKLEDGCRVTLTLPLSQDI